MSRFLAAYRIHTVKVYSQRKIIHLKDIYVDLMWKIMITKDE